jgi:hypothetical protein
MALVNFAETPLLVVSNPSTHPWAALPSCCGTDDTSPPLKSAKAQRIATRDAPTTVDYGIRWLAPHLRHLQALLAALKGGGDSAVVDATVQQNLGPLLVVMYVLAVLDADLAPRIVVRAVCTCSH